MTKVRSPLSILGLALALSFSATADAQDAQAPSPEKPGDYIEIGNEIGEFDGVRQLNIAAGNGNQQANVASVASGDFAINTAVVAQAADHTQPEESRTYSARIVGEAFADSHGLTAINIAAGSDNQQANLTLITTGLEGQIASTALLSQTRASSDPKGANNSSAASEYTAQIDPTAFGNSSGIVQVSLIGGTGNTSANVAVLSMEVGTN
ncbi:hypothetical protein [Erythrobacter rubeus]|uniref:Uncharacterized protein n=1 Tax=Erythrobacter rubeus TaxID=2760803 RepID=A0ABR8KNE4_9SPHN|nr:hypothetical protein [Erythrobacter rubeus]MBD2842125.1 hypothetical protein [Erythrobacter rubeus]